MYRCWFCAEDNQVKLREPVPSDRLQKTERLNLRNEGGLLFVYFFRRRLALAVAWLSQGAISEAAGA
jgi:hypothetical protein